jgi:hypothetical protein
MDILTLRSVVSATSSTIYCNLSVLNQANETISSGIANFTDGNQIQIDFYDSGDGNDQNEVYLDESWLPNSTDWFYISVSDCTEIDAIHLGEKSVSEYRDFPSYEATPSIFLYQAFFRHVGRILSDDPFDATELASREISLCRLEAHDLDAQDVMCVFNASKIKGKTEIFPDLNPFPCKSVNETTADENEVMSAGNCRECGKVIERRVYKIQLSGFEAFLCAIMLTVSVISSMKKIITFYFLNGNFGHRSVVEESHDHNDALKLRYPDDGRNTVTSTDLYQPDNILKPSVAEEYYTMIENASESLNADYASWGHDTESESELSTINDVTNTRSRSASSVASQHEIGILHEIQEIKNSDNSVEASTNTASRRGEDLSASMSVNLVELAFLAGD